MTMTRLRPSEIRYVQDSISNTFDKRSDHWNVQIGQTLDNLCNGRTTVDQIPTITVCERNGLYWSSDNRRLWVFKQLERLGGCTDIPVKLYGYWIIPALKFTTNNNGASVYVRGSPGGVWRCKPDGALIPNSSSIRVTQRNNPSQSGSGQLSSVNSLVDRLGNVQLTAGLRYDSHRIKYNNILGSLFRSDSSLQATRGNTLNPDDIKYSKLTISPVFSSGIHVGQSLDTLVLLLRTSNPFYRLNDVPPITVYHVYDDYWVVDGNKRLWAYRKAKNYIPGLKIPVVIRDDQEEFVARVRKNNKCQLTLRDIFMMGDDIEVT